MMKMQYLPNVVTLKLNEAGCNGCGKCLEVCTREVFSMNAKRVRITDRDSCMECGACARNCPTSALSVQAGVGCANAVINSAFGRSYAGCSCSLENQPEITCGPGAGSSGCCG
jgi:NAD-dependent dihydropyrimidine dehydrogenase PreA subunit